MEATNTTGYRENVLVLYDLRDPGQWKQAGHDRETWGRECSVIHSLDHDHVVIEFRPGGALEATA